MNEYEELVNDLRRMLASDKDPVESELHALDARWNEAVKKVNARLRECDRLLRAGHRSEAIQHYEFEPSLERLMQTLEFPEREQWDEFVQDYGLPVPPVLEVGIAADLNQAYAAEHELAPLLRLHRLHALAKSPLPTRLNLLRKVATADQGNTIWLDDIRSYERVRNTQIISEATLAMRDERASTLAELEAEVRSDNWLDPPPQGTINRVVEAHTKVRKDTARRELSKVADELNATHAEWQLETARDLRSRFDALTKLVGDPDIEVLDQVEPALRWLAEEDAKEQEQADYDNALAMLEHALDEGAPREQLEKLYYTVSRHEDRGVPEVIERRVAERVKAIDVAGSRRTKVVMLSTVLAVLAGVAGVGTWINVFLQSAEINRHAEAIAYMVAEGHLDEAQEYVADLEQNAPHVAESAPVREVISDLDAAVGKENQRQQARALYVDAARNLGVDNADMTTYFNAKKELEEAQKLSVSDAEHVEIKQLDGEIESKRLELKNAIDDKFKEDWAKLFAEFENVDETDVTTLEDIKARALALHRRPHVSAALKNLIPPVVARIDALVKRHEENRAESILLAEITKTIGNRGAFVQALSQYQARFPGTKREAAFGAVIEKEVDLWEGIDAWNQFVQMWEAQDLTRQDSEEARALVENAEQINEDHPGFPAAKPLQEQLKYVNSVIARADDAGNGVHLSLFQALDNLTVSEVQMVETRDGKRYYFQKAPFVSPLDRTHSFLYLTAFAAADTDRVRIKHGSIMNAPDGKDSFDFTSPQQKFGSFAKNKLTELSTERWEVVFFQIVSQLQTTPKDNIAAMEPVLRLQLLELFLEIACQGSSCLEDAFEQHVSTIDASSVDEDAVWLDPNDDDGRRASNEAARVLKSLPDIEISRSQIGAALKGLEKPEIGHQYLWLGWLYQKGSGSWHCTLAGGLQKEDIDLVTVYRQGQGQVVYGSIGEVRKGVVHLSSSPGPAFAEGRPVFGVVRSVSSDN